MQIFLNGSISPYPSLPIKKAVSPLKGCLVILWAYSHISTPQIDMFSSLHFYTITASLGNTSYATFLAVPLLPNNTLNLFSIFWVVSFSLDLWTRKTFSTLNAAALLIRVPIFLLFYTPCIIK